MFKHLNQPPNLLHERSPTSQPASAIPATFLQLLARFALFSVLRTQVTVTGRSEAPAITPLLHHVEHFDFRPAFAVPALFICKPLGLVCRVQVVKEGGAGGGAGGGGDSGRRATGESWNLISWSAKKNWCCRSKFFRQGKGVDDVALGC
jgi:hypothetical protein